MVHVREAAAMAIVDGNHEDSALLATCGAVNWMCQEFRWYEMAPLAGTWYGVFPYRPVFALSPLRFELSGLVLEQPQPSDIRMFQLPEPAVPQRP